MPHRVFGTKADRAVVCKECSALVLKPKRHRKWHKKNKPIPGPPGPVGMAGRDGWLTQPSSESVTKQYVEENL